MQQAPRRSTSKEAVTVLTKVQCLPIEHRAFAFILSMGLLGAVFGGVTTNTELRACLKSWDCVAMNPAEQVREGIKAGAYSGIAAAAILSLPAILKELGLR